MFTGIITDVGRIREISRNGDTRMEIETAYDTAGIDLGASIACSGVCLTVTDKGGDWFAVSVSSETLSCTKLGQWDVGSGVNLERSLRIGDEMGGHIVTGHVDGVAEVASCRKEGDSLRVQIDAPQALAKFIAPKGGVTLDGVSLTVNEVDGRRFGINLIPHTREHTTFGTLAEGDTLNLEIDVLARYVARLAEVDFK
jgi:riboflavin synthase